MDKNKVLVIYSFLFCFMPLLSSQNYITVTQNQSIQDDETLVSAEGTFEAGFFGLGNSQRQYFGIWYKSISPRTIVWVANRDAPVQNSTATIKLTDKGNLLILDGSKGIIWSSNGSRAAEKPYMQLLDSGNLVVKDGGKRKKNLIWESFDYPGDTLLAGMKIKSNLVKGPTSYLTSWRNTEDPASGEFSYLIDTRGFPQLVITRNATAYYRAGPWTGKLFSGSSWLRLRKILTFSMQFTSQEISLEYETANRSIITRAVINPSGTTQRLLWSDRSQSWEIISTHPTDQCTYYGLCGANSMCDISNNPICHCLEGFRPKFQAKWNSFDWPGGCVPMKNLSCQNGDGFLKHTGVKLPDTSSSWYGKNKSLDECGTLCLQNCSCTSYAYLDNDIGGSACLIWFGDILDLSIHPNPDQGQEIYIKVVASELDHRRNKKSFMTKKLAGSLAGIVALVICIIILGLATSTCIQRKKNERGDGGTMNHWKDKREDEDIDLGTIFDFSIISSVTDHFSESNKLGEGGFGPVYKGILANGQEIAVKRLSNASGQGMEEFKNEVKLIARLQHRNLVKLFGCSIHQDEKLLIYEFMHNRSLDYFIFDSTRSKLLDWNKRLQIIDGIARGLLYLHQDSRLRIIHRDLKTSNILLDNEMNPKISDFGLARIFIGDQVEARTKRVMGTYGYMPPEYAVHGSFSIKSDVFSFGVIVLEIISGKKIRKFYDPHHHLNLLSHAWRLWIEGSPLELVDKLFEDSIIPTEILRYIHVALLCVQRRPETRPDMLSIVLMLNGEKELPKPSLPAFYTGKHDPILLESPSRRCSTSVTISLEAR
ncbi:G-type lectin S-receptor-like serine/threonine-protein kinase At4g27290 isoform X1 [Lotus japonicus]|uniref:G-type lectin S-receptor-like serine/threonine-protein kinase At4g27290 isoform X1 n=1 Tax=Lotus japonicus TaxID=34305 RepID=UPI0025872F00|nr:G-type lectin S-receptor-like serine/threonine-protein kinase At4g27290 isoform X1 [Lotus japonicus]